ncbi:tyrosine-type recombinase/integrase [Aestuariimicrobium sp. Y1814]|uniref:tyrosine-type recombinase/integrase n=1 Tax=Aestuariimicrobium sp. Y1814 TaxID=3418742 RepID=UPI003DA7333B
MAKRKEDDRPPIGTVRVTASGAWRAEYERGGVGGKRSRHYPDNLFASRKEAVQWLKDEKALIDAREWTPPAERRAQAKQAEAEAVKDATTFGEYAENWISNRTTGTGRPLAPKTATEYRGYLRGRLAGLAERPLVKITRDDLDQWWRANADKLTARQHAYLFAKSVFKDAVSRGLVDSNPCQVANASRRARATPKQVRSQLVVNLRPEDIDALTRAMPDRWQFLVSLVAFCGLRPGEAFALTRKDIRREADTAGLPRYLLSIHKGVSTGEDGTRALGDTKTEDSIRTVPLPPHLASVLDRHEAEHADPGEGGLIFPSTNPGVPYATTQQVMGTYPSNRQEPGRSARQRQASGFAAARLAIGRPTLRLYDLRHWARGVWNSTGLDFASVEMLLGHTLPMVVGTYAHLDLDHVWPHAVKVSELAGWQRPATAPAGTPAIHPRLLAAMTPEQLRDTLAGLTDAQLAATVPELPPHVLARALEM